jgi:hypothetical protein
LSGQRWCPGGGLSHLSRPCLWIESVWRLLASLLWKLAAFSLTLFVWDSCPTPNS